MSSRPRGTLPPREEAASNVNPLVPLPSTSAAASGTATPNLRRPIRWRCFLRNTIHDVLRAREGWVENESETDWDFAWADVGWVHQHMLEERMVLAEHQRLNHYPNHYELTRKDLLMKNLKRARRNAERDGAAEAARYDFFPTTYLLPSEYNMFVEEFKKHPSGTVWIMKPIGRAQGKGIFLFTKLAEISEWRKAVTWTKQEQLEKNVEQYVVQRYLANPLLVGGKKFDMRIYAMVVSYRPLRVYLYRSGFCRFTNFRYSLESIEDLYLHLTNTAVQKTSPVYDPNKGTKWSLRNLRLYIHGKHGPEVASRLFADIQELILRALRSVEHVIINDKHCFELYGYDIMIDSNLKPWLIEVNASPSLTADTPSDYKLKFGMLNDMLDLVDMEGGREVGNLPMRMGGFDLIWNDGPIESRDRERATDFTSLLGTLNDSKNYEAAPMKRPGKVMCET